MPAYRGAYANVVEIPFLQYKSYTTMDSLFHSTLLPVPDKGKRKAVFKKLILLIDLQCN